MLTLFSTQLTFQAHFRAGHVFSFKTSMVSNRLEEERGLRATREGDCEEVFSDQEAIVLRITNRCNV